MDTEDGPSRLEGFALYLNIYFVALIGLVAARNDSIVPVWLVACWMGMFFLPLALFGFALIPLAARRAWYFVRLAVALAVVLTVLWSTLEAPSTRTIKSSYVVGVLGLLAVSGLIRVAAAGSGSSASSRGSSDE